MIKFSLSTPFLALFLLSVIFIGQTVSAYNTSVIIDRSSITGGMVPESNITTSVSSGNTTVIKHSETKVARGSPLSIPNNIFVPYNQYPVSSLNRTVIAPGLELPKNLIIATCQHPSATSTACIPIVGTNGPDIIIATAVNDAQIYGLGGNDIIQCGTGNCKAYGGSGDNLMMASSSSTAQLYGGYGNNIFVGGAGDTLMVGGKGNDQFYAGSGHDVMIGGGGSNYFDCGPNGNGVILDFNAKNGDTKAGNCKYIITVNSGISPLP